jgi:hypothetical protein
MQEHMRGEGRDIPQIRGLTREDDTGTNLPDPEVPSAI